MFNIVRIIGGRRNGKQLSHRFPLKMNDKGKYIKTFIIDNCKYEKAIELVRKYLKERMLETGFIYDSHKIHNSSDFVGKFKIIAIGILKEDEGNAEK